MRVIPFSVMAWPFSPALLAGLLLGGCLSPQERRTQATDHYQLGMTLLATAGPASAGEAELKKAIRDDPQFAPPHNALAQLWAREGKHSRDEIVAEYETALRLDPHLAEAHLNLGLLLVKEPEHRAAAVGHFRAALDENPADATAWTHLGDALRETTDWDGAVLAYRRAAALPTADRYAWFRVGSTLRDRPGHEDEAIVCFESALKVDPDQVISLTCLGLMVSEKPGRGAEAVQHLEKAARLEPTMSINWSNLGRVHYQQGNITAAQAGVEKALALDPQSFAAYQLRADLRLWQGDWAAALADYEKVVEINPQYAEILLQIGTMRAQHKADYDGAIDSFSRALAVAPNYAAAYGYRSAAWMDKKNFESAAADIERAIKLDPGTAWYWSLRGEIKLRQDEPTSALVDFEYVLSILPNDERSLIQRGTAFYQLSELESALRDAEAAIKLNPKSSFSHGLRGRLRQLTGDQAGAIADFTSAITFGMERSEVYFNRGMSRDLLDDFPRALKDYERAMELGTETRMYVGYWAFFARIRLNLPPDENDLKARGLGSDQMEWMHAITSYLSGEIDEVALLARAKADPKKAIEQACEGYYYIGMRRLLVDRDSEAARPYFEKCIATNVRKFAEYSFSKRELARMDKAAKQKTESRGQKTGDAGQKADAKSAI